MFNVCLVDTSAIVKSVQVVGGHIRKWLRQRIIDDVHVHILWLGGRDKFRLSVIRSVPSYGCIVRYGGVVRHLGRLSKSVRILRLAYRL
jgi:hypothetical protein